MPVSDYSDIIDRAAAEWNVHPALIRAIMAQESNGVPGLTSTVRGPDGRPMPGARGLMQLMPATAKDLGVTNIDDPEQNIFGGAKYLSQMLDQYKGNPVHAIAAYNAGPGTVDAVLAGRGRLPDETTKYIPQVMAHYSRFLPAAQPGQEPVLNPTPTPRSSPSYGDVNDVTTVASQAEGDALPPGARFLLPDGTSGRVPPASTTAVPAAGSNAAPSAPPADGKKPESDAAFLARTGGVASTATAPATAVPAPDSNATPPPVVKGSESDKDFLARTGGIAPTPDAPRFYGIDPLVDPEAQMSLSMAPAVTKIGEKIAANIGPAVADLPPVANPLGWTGPGMVATALNPNGTALTRAAQGFRNAFGSEPVGAPEATNLLRSAGIIPDPATGQGGPVRSINEAVVSPLLTGANLLYRGIPAAYAGAQGLVSGALTGLGASDQFARDFVSMPDAFMGSPGHFQTPVPRGLPADTPVGAPAPMPLPQIAALDMRSPLNKLTAAINNVPDPPPTMLNQLTGAIQNADTLPIRAPRPDAPPPMEIASPAPVNGPATLPRTNNLDLRPGPTPAEAPAVAPAPMEAPGTVRPAEAIPNGLTAEQIAEIRNIPDALPTAPGPINTPADANARADQIIKHFAGIGNVEPIPGATGSLSDITRNAGLATLYRAVRDSDTPVPFTTLENNSRTATGNSLGRMAGTPDTLAADVKFRRDETRPMYEAAWGNKTPADPTGPIGAVDQILSGPAKQNDTVRPELMKIKKALTGETDPEQLKGISDNIDTTLSNLSSDGKADAETRRVLGTVKDAITNAISQSTPGFDAAQARYSELSRRIDEQKYFQGRKLTDLQGLPTLSQIRTTLDDIAKKQAGDRFHPADSVTPENMAILQGLHDQMQREAFTQSAGKALGSNTFQNLSTAGKVNSLVGHVAGSVSGGLLGAGTDMMAGGGGMTGGVLGTVMGGTAKYMAERSALKRAAETSASHRMLMDALRDRLLNIDDAGVNALRKAPPATPNRLDPGQ